MLMSMTPVLGGPYNGFSATQTLSNFKDGEQAATRSILRNGWNTRCRKPRTALSVQ